MHILTTTLFILSATTLLVQAGSIPPTKSEDIPLQNNGFSVKTGYEGYIAVADPAKKSSDVSTIKNSSLLTKIYLLKGVLIKATGLLLPFALKILAGAKFLSIVALIGVGVTNAVCSATSLCSFSLNLPEINQEEVRERIGKIAEPFMSEENLEKVLSLAKAAARLYD